MGQGTLTGLAQLVAEELECDWSKVTTEFPTPGQNLARKRVWGDFATGGSRGIRGSHEYVRQGGAAAREMLIQAAAAEWKVPAAECSAANSVITHKASGRTTTFGKVAEAAAKLDAAEGHQAQGPQGLEDRRQGRQAARHARQAHRQAGLRHRHQDARHADRDHQGFPGHGGKIKSFDAAKVDRHARRQEGGAGRRHAASPSSPTRSGMPRPPSTRCRSSGIRARTPRCRAPRSPSSSRPVSTPTRPLSATRPATRRPPSRAPPARSRRSTAIRSRTTPPWSR